MLNLESKQVARRADAGRGGFKAGPSLWCLRFGAGSGALSDQLVWVLGSFSDAETAEQVAREVQELTGQSGYVCKPPS